MVVRHGTTLLLTATGLAVGIVLSMSNGLAMAKLPVSRIGFQAAQYLQMRDDVARTSAYYQAIDAMVPGRVVLDLGTGALALLAVRCAQAGAAHVYAVEAAPAVADMAQQAVNAAGLAERITILTGSSQELELPTCAEIVVHEILGEIASREGVAHALRDAAGRHVCELSRRMGSWSVPRRAITWVTPVQLPDLSLFEANPANLEAVIEAARADFEDPFFVRDFPVSACALAQSEIFEELCFSDPEPPIPPTLRATRDEYTNSTLMRQVRVHEFVVERAGYLAGFALHITMDCGGNALTITSAESGSHWSNGLILVKTKKLMKSADELERLVMVSTQVIVSPGDIVELHIDVNLEEVQPLYNLFASLRPSGSTSVETLLDCVFG